MGRKLLLLFLLVSFTGLAQEVEYENLFSQAIEKNIKKYKIQSKQAYLDQNYERADFLFDSLINNVVNGSRLDNFDIRKTSGKKIDFYDFEKPVFLITYASWCTPGVGEIPALNKIVDENYKEIDFVVLFWDSKKKVKKKARDYSNKIRVVYVDETENTHDHIVQTMKHSLGFPTSFFIDSNKTIIDVRRGVLHPYNEAYNVSYEMNYDSFHNGISLIKSFDVNNQSDIVAKDNP
ncbi:TlpA family protein disulfide reductase [Marixanthomonas ophiurae]|uniref:TlpA family protein disulfide reductase n=1 Tax=Marixanthomonas ophiurae TaxID=387659 RepID=A0A3E1Q6W2_9FLAO|nr:redoxin domain-containing protein [Marixanthomonas ophiurae]RFN57866.1 TlpA family protein disulfide reductase [Marixanthomonas ophiurae]